MSQKVPVDGFEWKNMSKSNESSIKNYDEDSDVGYILEVDVKYPKWLHNLHNDLLFLPERMKNKKWHKLVCNLHNKKNYVAQVRTLEQASDHGLILKKVLKVIKFNQKTWLKLYIYEH